MILIGWSEWRLLETASNLVRLESAPRAAKSLNRITPLKKQVEFILEKIVFHQNVNNSIIWNRHDEACKWHLHMVDGPSIELSFVDANVNISIGKKN